MPGARPLIRCPCSIIATIISVHIPRNATPAPTQLSPGMRIQAMDIVHPPGMAMPPDIDWHQTTVPTALAMNSSRLPVRRRRSARSGDSSARREITGDQSSYRSWCRTQACVKSSASSSRPFGTRSR